MFDIESYGQGYGVKHSRLPASIKDILEHFLLALTVQAWWKMRIQPVADEILKVEVAWRQIGDQIGHRGEIGSEPQRHQLLTLDLNLKELLSSSTSSGWHHSLHWIVTWRNYSRLRRHRVEGELILHNRFVFFNVANFFFDIKFSEIQFSQKLLKMTLARDN